MDFNESGAEIGDEYAYLSERPDDPILPSKLDNLAAELKIAYNRGWKVDPKDIADFYLLENFMNMPRNAHTPENDTENVLLLKSRNRIREISHKLFAAVLHELSRDTQMYEIAVGKKSITDEQRHDLDTIDAILAKLDAGESPEIIFADSKLLRRALDTFGSLKQQTAWLKVVNLLKQYLSPQKEKSYDSENPDRTRMLLIDMLINVAHSNGQLIGYVSNDIPEMALVLAKQNLKRSLPLLFLHASEFTKSNFPGGRFLVPAGEQQARISSGLTDGDIHELVDRMKRNTTPEIEKVGVMLGCDNESVRKPLIEDEMYKAHDYRMTLVNNIRQFFRDEVAPSI